MNLRQLQTALGIRADGVLGPVTTAEILAAAHEGRLTAIPRVSAPVTTIFTERANNSEAASQPCFFPLDCADMERREGRQKRPPRLTKLIVKGSRHG